MAALLAGCASGAGNEAGDPASPTDATTTSTQTGAASEPLRVGLLLPFSGPLAALGESVRNGFQLYVDENGGRLGGREVTYSEEDTEFDPNVGLQKAQRLVEESQVDVIVGPVSSAVALAIRDYVVDNEVITVVPVGSADAITGERRSDFMFRTSITSSQDGSAGAHWVHENVAQDGVVVTAADYAAGQEISGAFTATFEELGGEVSGTVLAPPGTRDFQPFLTRIRDLNPEAVYAFYAGGDAINFVKQYAGFGLSDIPLMGNAITDESILPAQGEAALGVLTAEPWARTLDNDTNAAFVSSYDAAYGDPPDVNSVYAFDAAQLLDAALKAVSGDTSDVSALVEAMEEVGVIDSPRGEIEMDPASHMVIQDFYARRVEQVDGAIDNVIIGKIGRFQGDGSLIE